MQLLAAALQFEGPQSGAQRGVVVEPLELLQMLLSRILSSVRIAAL